jgi:hypothetical protein
VAREVVRLTDQVVLDIAHRRRDEYAHARALRVHPWLGPELAEPMFLFDPTHFFELAQASARGQFHRAENVGARARTFLAWARRELHISALPGAEPDAPVTLAGLSLALLYAANAAITLTAFPGAGRRLVMKLEAAADRLGRPDLHEQFLALYAGPSLPRAEAEPLLAAWSAAYRAGASPSDELIHPARRTLYERGFRAQIEADRAAEMLWLLLYTWQACLRQLPADSPHADAWAAALERLALAAPEDYAGRVLQAARYLTLVDETVEAWCAANGA